MLSKKYLPITISILFFVPLQLLAAASRPSETISTPVKSMAGSGTKPAQLTAMPPKYDDTAANLIKVGNDTFKEGNRDAAIKNYEQAISLLEKMPNNHKALAIALARCANAGLCEDDKDHWGKYKSMCERSESIIEADRESWMAKDFLKRCYPQTYRLFIANPPKVSIADCEKKAKEYVKVHYPSKLKNPLAGAFSWLYSVTKLPTTTAGYPWDEETRAAFVLTWIDTDKLDIWQQGKQLDFDRGMSESVMSEPDKYKSTSLPIASEALSVLTESYLKANDMVKAEPYARRCINAMQLANNPVGTVNAFAQLIDILIELGKYSDAEHSCKDAIDYATRIYGNNDLRVANFLELQGILQKKQENDKAATTSWTAELAIRNKHADEKQTFRFLEGAPNCEHSFKGGNIYEKISTDDAVAEIAFVPCDDCLRCDVHITNTGSKAVDVLPENVSLYFCKGSGIKASSYEWYRPASVKIDRFKDKELTLTTVAPGNDVAGIVCFQRSLLDSDKALKVSQLQITFGNAMFSFH